MTLSVTQRIRGIGLPAAVLGTMFTGSAGAGDTPVQATAQRSEHALSARPCLVSTERCVDLSNTPFAVCHTTSRCERQAVTQPLARRAAVYR